jgi:hypothetical protein
MKQTEKREIINFVLASLASDELKTGTQLMEEYASHAELKEYNRKNLKQVFHRIGLSLAEQGKLVVTRQPGNAPLLFSNAARQQEVIHQSKPEPIVEVETPEKRDIPLLLSEKLDHLAEQEAILSGKETGVRILLEVAPEQIDELSNMLKKIRFERISLQACRQVIEDYARAP